MRLTRTLPAATIKSKARGLTMATLSTDGWGWYAAVAAQAGDDWWSLTGDTWTVSIDGPGYRKVMDFFQGMYDDKLIAADPLLTPTYNKQINDGTMLSWPSAARAPGVVYGVAPKTAGKRELAPLPRWDANEPTVSYQEENRVSTTAPRSAGVHRAKIVPTLVLILGAVYCLIPVAWVFIASTKTPGELFSSFTFAPGTDLWQSLRNLFRFSGGVFGLWALNSLLYAGVGAALSTLISAAAGYALAKFDFLGGRMFFRALLAGLLIPGIVLAIPQYLLLSEMGLAGTRGSVLLPSLIRIDGANEARIFRSIVLPLLVPGMVTVFLLTFVGIWNNLLLPFIMLSDQSTFPLTVGLSTLLNRGSGSPALYSLAIIGSAVAILPLIGLVLFLQRFWRLDLVSGVVQE